MRLALAAALGSLLLLLAPLPPRLAVPLLGGWVVLLAGILVWQLLEPFYVQRHLIAAWLRIPSRRAPVRYVRALFDEYAGRYDGHLLRDLHYAAPNLVRTIVGDRLDGRPDAAVADLGCGTGLCGPLFRRVAGRLVGVDLSPRMLDEARRREVYDELVEAEIVAFLRDRRDDFDLLIAADVLVYLGDLGPLFRAAALALRPAGLMALTVEEGSSDGFALRSSGRFVHGRAYVERAVLEAGLRLVAG
ncbi:MAG TPA: methyltransferase domain-containing protein, partial [Geminicoccaceae bacterium]|nr:methyltransferase domain-containing protein [Geminicoccaceae bacterium]